MKSTEVNDLMKRGYELTDVCLGEGCYSIVRLAYATTEKLKEDTKVAHALRHKRTNMVAVKIISLKRISKVAENYIPHEIEAMASTADSKLVIQLYEHFSTKKRVYLIMEYASKGDLEDYISRSSKSSGVGEEKAKLIFKQLVNGLLYCHRQNVVHRDLKCANILIDGGKDTVKIIDFGFAMKYQENKLIDTFPGTPKYAAPEVMKNIKYDGKIADVWSLGVILFFMLNGRLPSKNISNIRLLIKRSKKTPKFSKRVKVSDNCKDLVNRMMMANISKRATIDEILRHPWLNNNDRSHDIELLKKPYPSPSTSLRFNDKKRRRDDYVKERTILPTNSVPFESAKSTNKGDGEKLKTGLRFKDRKKRKIDDYVKERTILPTNSVPFESAKSTNKGDGEKLKTGLGFKDRERKIDDYVKERTILPTNSVPLEFTKSNTKEDGDKLKTSLGFKNRKRKIDEYINGRMILPTNSVPLKLTKPNTEEEKLGGHPWLNNNDRSHDIELLKSLYPSASTKLEAINNNIKVSRKRCLERELGKQVKSKKCKLEFDDILHDQMNTGTAYSAEPSKQAFTGRRIKMADYIKNRLVPQTNGSNT